MTDNVHMTTTTSPGFSTIVKRYLLVTYIPYYVDEVGDIWLNEGWHRDLQQHTEYLLNLHIVAPRFIYKATIKNLVRLESQAAGCINFIPIRSQASLKLAIKNFPNTLSVIRQEVKTAALVHSNIVGWPFPIGWIANAWALIYKRKLILVVESAPWRNPQHTIKGKLMSWLMERMGRFFMHRADLAIATQARYLQTLRRASSQGATMIAPASWVNQEEIISADQLIYSWEKKRHAIPIRLLFAGRMSQDKGIHILLGAIDIIQNSGLEVQIDLIGEGSLREICSTHASNIRPPLVVKVLQPVSYGPVFFSLLRNYHAVLIPSLGDEQPRILFDAFTQGVPVIATDTDGIAPYVSKNVGWLIAKGKSDALALAISDVVSNPHELERRGILAHQSIQNMTHRDMHIRRSREIAKL